MKHVDDIRWRHCILVREFLLERPRGVWTVVITPQKSRLAIGYVIVDESCERASVLDGDDEDDGG